MSKTHKPHRPTRYSGEVALRLYQIVAGSNLSLAEIVEADPSLPEVATIKLWLSRHATFRGAWNGLCFVRPDAAPGTTDGICESASADAKDAARKAKARAEGEKALRQAERLVADVRKKKAACEASRREPARAGAVDRARAGNMPAREPGHTIH